MAPLELLPDDLGFFDDKKTLPKEFGNLIRRKRLVQ